MTEKDHKKLTNTLKLRAAWLRRQVFESVVHAQKGHLGGTYSCIDILVTLYFGGIMRFDPANPDWPERDRFLIGKGHASLALYHIWAELGILDKTRLKMFCADGGLGSQLDISIPGAEHNTGSLGHAIGIGSGLAMAAKYDKHPTKIFALVGDAECDEGAIWESIMFAAENGLSNLIGIIDRNRFSVTESLDDDRGSGKLEAKFAACNWECRVIDGHSFSEILKAFSHIEKTERPVMVIANTIKGKGVSFMENGVKWHHTIPSPEEIKIARAELSEPQ